MTENEARNGQTATYRPAVPARPRRKAPARDPGQAAWLTTFADLVTLLLTFLVLLIGITTMDPRSALWFQEGSLTGDRRPAAGGGGVLLFSDWGMLAPVVELAENIDRLPEDVMFDQSEIKNAIFQLDPARTPDYERLQEAAERGVEIFRDNRGLAVRWDRSLLFPEGGAEMFDENLPLLQKLAALLVEVNLPVSVEGFTNPLSELEGGDGPASFELSLRRAGVVMEYLVSLGVPERRFRIGGRGGARPLTDDPELAWRNSRLEIVIYKPEPTSILGR